ncbi:hypothetical protein [Sphaerimonospora thailandensis]|uniref:Uncharacterized protein n=1 Tax=Sphaerimonospora thailandensis TaxID=795644 RepID=A0A8J3VYF8_9ACTN|nr:hypothetical protein [Sphaerimonospora thailandensis]GIH68958.1 hypothetical protein Mth01_12110 [Sphaerimonospora thailandensis]
MYPPETPPTCDSCIREPRRQSRYAPSAYSRLNLCDECIKADIRCYSCQVRAAFSDGRLLRGTVKVDDRDYRCSYCASPSLVESQDAADKVLYSTRNWLDKWFARHGEEEKILAKLSISVTLVDAATLATGDGEKGTILGRAIWTRGSTDFQIKIIRKLRVVPFLETLAHELTHVWAYRTGNDGKEAIEGFCNYVAYMALGTVHGKLADDARRREAYMLKEVDIRYGGDFKAIRLGCRSETANPVTFFKKMA